MAEQNSSDEVFYGVNEEDVDRIRKGTKKSVLFLGSLTVLFGLTTGILLFIVVVKMGTEATQCTLDPLNFGVRQLEAVNRKQIQCSCSLVGSGQSQSLNFNGESQWITNPLGTDSGRSYPVLNESVILEVFGNGS